MHHLVAEQQIDSYEPLYLLFKNDNDDDNDDGGGGGGNDDGDDDDVCQALPRPIECWLDPW